MRSFSFLLILVVLSTVSYAAFAKNTPGRVTDQKFIESPQPPSNPPEIGGSMYQGAAANTIVLGWWQFDGPGGVPDKQGWTEHDVSGQTATYFHVAGSSGGCDPIAPLSGTKSMWCGRWSSTGEPWCGWVTLPGYGNDWEQRLQSTVNATTVTYTIEWETEAAYDRLHVEWWDPYYPSWIPDETINGGQGFYDGGGGPQTETSMSDYGSTKVRFRFDSDGWGSDEDGNAPSVEGAVKLDDLSLDGAPAEDWEGEECNALQSSDGKWVTAVTPPFGSYAALHHGSSVVQEDPCFKQRSWLWGFFDDPASTNYACGGWPLQGAVPWHSWYGYEDAMYLNNEIWSPWIPVSGAGSQYLLEFLTYRDLPLDNLIVYTWHVRSRNNDTGGCPTNWTSSGYVGYGNRKDWYRARVDFGGLIGAAADEIQVSLGAWDAFEIWGGAWEVGCHSHAPLFDQVRVLHVEAYGPYWTVRDIDLWQDNFPELGGISATSYARCDMAMDSNVGDRKAIVPGDSLRVVVTDPAGLAADNTGGRSDTKAVYVFVRATDRYGNPVGGKTGLALQSPDTKRWSGDPESGMIRYPHIAGLAPPGWDAYRLDIPKAAWGAAVKDAFCGDLMDLAAGPDGPPYHPNENQAANTGIFAPGDVIRYFFAAKNTLNHWSYWHRALNGQGVGRRTNVIAEAMESPCEWSVLPDAGRQSGDVGDILLVDDADDRGGPAQLYFDWAFKLMNMEDRVDRFDVLGPSSYVANSLAGRVKDIQTQIIGDPTEVYQVILWNCADLSVGLMGDGRLASGGSSYEKSDDFSLCYTFLNTHPSNPGWAYWGDDVAYDWRRLTGVGAVAVKNTFMNHTFVADDQRTASGVTSPTVLPPSPLPPAGHLQPVESFYLHGGCYSINDFDVLGQTGSSRVAHRYMDPVSGQTAALSQPTVNTAATTARFYLAGFGHNFIRDDETNGMPDYAKHLHELLAWFESGVSEPTGVEPVAYANRLDNAYPNPFNPTTTIKYSIAASGHVSLRIYNAAGQLVRTLVDEDQVPAAEGFSVTWDGKNSGGQGVSSGVYFYRFAAKEFSDTKKMVLLR